MSGAAPTVRHPGFARVYAVLSRAMERSGMAEHRRELLAGLRGDVVEVGAGNGLSFRHYPSTVRRVIAVEPEPHLRRLALRAAADAPVRVEVVDGVASTLPVEDGVANAVVCSLVLCSVPEQAAALAEVRRVLASTGELRFLEHVRAASGVGAGVQQALDATVWPRLAGGCRSARDTVGAVREAGFSITALRRFRYPGGLPAPTAPHVLGTARPV
jgi:ubiquinone/menaquinone biosynthesis C-methylase UbiE